MEFYYKVHEIVQNVIGKDLRGEFRKHLIRTLEHGARDLRRDLAKANITENIVSTEFWIPELKDGIGINITVPVDVYEQIM